jgi:catechol 2,3-dioxygenase-like lactoylglutathione lyase family enzyme
MLPYNIHHVAIAVNDLDAAIASFAGQYGFEVLSRERICAQHARFFSAQTLAIGHIDTAVFPKLWLLMGGGRNGCLRMTFCRADRRKK